MRLFIVFQLAMLIHVVTSAQFQYIDSLKHDLAMHKNDDTAKVTLLNQIAYSSIYKRVDSAINYAAEMIALSDKLGYKYGEALGFIRMSNALNVTGNYPKALESVLDAKKIIEKLEYRKEELQFQATIAISIIYSNMGDYNKAKSFLYSYTGMTMQKQISGYQKSLVCNQLAYNFLNLNKLDSAFYYAQQNFQYEKAVKNPDGFDQYRLGTYGNVNALLGNYGIAEDCIREAIRVDELYGDVNNEIQMYQRLANVLNKTGRSDSAIYYVRKSLLLCQEFGYPRWALDASKTLTNLYEQQNKPDSVVKYMTIMLAAKDSLFNQQKIQQFQLVSFDEQQRQREEETAKKEYRNKVRTYLLIAGLGVFVLITLILYNSNKRNQRTNKALEATLKNLKLTQAQLIQSEKMASLGELTAGIAHEIQNPLNFVNNFSEVNVELIEEIKSHLASGGTKLKSEELDELLNDIAANEEKIIFHGKRADGIVKGMLQHSRSSSGVKEPTDINALADEYLRLAYHGLRAKDNSFNATMKTDYDESIGNINVVPQDIGRVLLNLYNNAFYAVTEKARLADISYEPLVVVSTKRKNGKVEFTVSDNGDGIPQKVIDKIFQPFFTTKPTGQGTGLGLSLSYDIVKAHGGEIKVETKDGEATTFIIQLPIT
ncbi:MAG: ATP-binding protein [Chitinophagales bacterium]